MIDNPRALGAQWLKGDYDPEGVLIGACLNLGAAEMGINPLEAARLPIATLSAWLSGARKVLDARAQAQKAHASARGRRF